jgi:hypothetical protein
LEAGAFGSLERHSQEEPELVMLNVRAERAADCSFDPERDVPPPGTQQPIGQTRLEQQLRTASRVTDLAASAIAPPANDSIPAIAASAIRPSRTLFERRVIAIPGPDYPNFHTYTSYAEKVNRATANRAALLK